MKKVLTTHSDSDKIIGYLQGKEGYVLTPKLEEKLERMQECQNLIREHTSRVKVIPMLKSMFGIKQSQAYSIYEDTVLIFGDNTRSSRKFWLDVLLEEFRDDLKDARDKEDYKAVAAIQRNLLNLVNSMVGDAENDFWDELQPVNIIMGYFPNQVNVHNISDEEIEKSYKKLSQPKRKKDIWEENSQEVEENAKEQ